MQDRYLFRGKRIDNGEWVVGQYVNTCYPGNDKKTGHFIVVYPNEYHEIYTSTICQCIGLRDDHKNMIFKNDILSLKDEINEIEWKAVVKFGNPNGEYTWGWQLVPVGEFEGNKDILLWIETEMEYMQCEVIGNVIDNPELLEVQE